MSLHTAMIEACRAIGIAPPRHDPQPGRFVRSDDLEKRAGNGNGSITINADGRTGCAWNHRTGQHQRFWAGAEAGVPAPAVKADPAADRAAEAERREVAAACLRIVRACQTAPHPYLSAKGFPDEMGLVIDAIRPHLPGGALGRAMAAALPDGGGPFLIVPGRIGATVTTVQIITPEGVKKNIYRGQMGGAAHRIATGRETWVCEGIATALSVRAALRLLGRPATVWCAFSAANVAKVASRLPGAIIAADHDRPNEALGGLGTGEFYAVRSGCRWAQPAEPGDWNDLHQAHGLRAVALALREVKA